MIWYCIYDTPIYLPTFPTDDLREPETRGGGGGEGVRMLWSVSETSLQEIRCCSDWVEGMIGAYGI